MPLSTGEQHERCWCIHELRPGQQTHTTRTNDRRTDIRGNVGNHAMASYSTTKKARERYMALEAAKLLARQWVLSDHEAPDFIVTEDGERFGLELCEVFSGRETRKGSARKDQEVRVQRCIDRLRKQDEAETGTPLSVRLVGCLSHENLKGLVPALLALDLASERQDHLTRFSLDESEASLSVHVCRALPGHARWFSVNDRVGWVDRNPTPRIQAAVDAKAAHLARYRARTGLPEQRLLLFCDATTNSGKLRVGSGVEIDPSGLDAVYFFTYPDAVTVLAGILV